ncbi:MAG: gliding motility-associated-like protein [Bacteroidia bacterium]|jgi:gliding motility-associated-like protein
MTFSVVQATHIVGGDFYYEQVSPGVYDITLKLYMDCENGNPGAILADAQAYVSIWDANTNSKIRTETFSRTGPKYLDKVHYKCLIPPKDVCVSEYVYRKRLSITPGKDGVILAFQRCCRNNSINNINSPESTGATYWVKIPGTKLVTTNSSAIFKELPPNYLCTDAPLKFDHSASDADGDSLVYELYQPYQGASRDLPRPNGSAPNGTAGGYFKAPPFQNVIWGIAYSTTNQVTGDPKMEINRLTGELTLTPSTVGQYVIGIKVLEYRDGELIGETLRDYQFNVRICQTTLVSNFQISAGSSALVYSCTDTVDFVNKSQKAKQYFWTFGDPSTEQDTSSETNPRWIYPGNGEYLVTLKAWNDVCEDDYQFLVRIQSNVEVELGPDLFFCEEVDRYISPRKYDATKIAWNTGQFGQAIRAKDTGRYIATVYYGACFGSDSVDLFVDPVEMEITLDSLFCTVEEVSLTLDAGISGPNIKYRWSTGFKDTFQTLFIDEPGSYWVRVENSHCRAVDSTNITIAKPEIGDYLFVCNEFQKEFDPGEYDGATYLWSNGATTRNTIISTPGEHWVTVTYKHCITSDTITIENPIINLDLGIDSNYCDDLLRSFTAPPDMFSYLWHDGSSKSMFTTTEPGKFYVHVVDTNGCEKSDTIRLTKTNSPQFDIGADTTLCLRSFIQYGVSDDYIIYEWNTGQTQPVIIAKDSGYYILKVIDEFGCSGYDTAHVDIDPNALPNILYIPNAFSPNGDKLNELFPFTLEIPQPEYQVRVYTLWGEKIFDSEISGTQSWDATYNGKPVEADTYIYTVRYRSCDGQQKRVKGSVNVME